MVKASALYLVIVIALVIGVICSALIAGAYYYRIQYQRQMRYSLLQNNAASGINYLLAGKMEWDAPKTFSLFNKDNDSVLLEKKFWGIYDVCVVRAFIQADTLTKVFTMAHPVDSAKWAVLYLIDEDRSMSVSGKTLIKGNSYIPKSGIREAYVDNQPYQGDKKLIIGHRYNSDKKLPSLQKGRLTLLNKYWKTARIKDSSTVKGTDSLNISFRGPTRFINLKKKVSTLSNIKLSGNVVIVSDTLLTIDSTVSLKNVLIFAKAIVVKNGFNGNCQLFASDSISIGTRCKFNYPSSAGILRFDESKSQEILRLGDNSAFSGLLFTYEQKGKLQLQPFIDLGKNIRISGQVYSQGMVGMHSGVTINGSVFTSRFVYQSTFTRYENYIINASLDMTALSRYYLSGDIVPVTQTNKKIMQWLEQN